MSPVWPQCPRPIDEGLQRPTVPLEMRTRLWLLQLVYHDDFCCCWAGGWQCQCWPGELKVFSGKAGLKGKVLPGIGYSIPGLRVILRSGFDRCFDALDKTEFVEQWYLPDVQASVARNSVFNSSGWYAGHLRRIGLAMVRQCRAGSNVNPIPAREFQIIANDWRVSEAIDLRFGVGQKVTYEGLDWIGTCFGLSH